MSGGNEHEDRISEDDVGLAGESDGKPLRHRALARTERPTGRGPAYQSSDAARDAARSVRSIFGDSLQRRLIDAGMNQSAFARACEKFMPNGERFGRDSVSGYIRRGNIPDPIRVKAMCQVLKCTPDDLLKDTGVPVVGGEIHAPQFSSAGIDDMDINVNQVLPIVDGLSILHNLHQMLRGGDDEILRIRSVDNHMAQIIIKMIVPIRLGIDIIRALNDLYRGNHQ